MVVRNITGTNDCYFQHYFIPDFRLTGSRHLADLMTILINPLLNPAWINTLFIF